MSLNFLASKNCSKVSHHAVMFGAAFTKRPCTSSSICKSTARLGSDGAQGKSPYDNSVRAGSVQVQIDNFSISRINGYCYNMSNIPKKLLTIEINTSYIQHPSIVAAITEWRFTAVFNIPQRVCLMHQSHIWLQHCRYNDFSPLFPLLHLFVAAFFQTFNIIV